MGGEVLEVGYGIGYKSIMLNIPGIVGISMFDRNIIIGYNVVLYSIIRNKIGCRKVKQRQELEL